MGTVFFYAKKKNKSEKVFIPYLNTIVQGANIRIDMLVEVL